MPVQLPEPILTTAVPSLETPIEASTRLSTSQGEFAVQRLRLQEGIQRDVELLLVQSDRVRAAICPTRGMAIWRANIDGVQLGWRSPVQGPIHPSWVPSQTPIGWLEGFDELFVRCGMRSFGAPDFSPNGQLQYPLHGRLANLPARKLQLEVDADESVLEVQGEVCEVRFLQYSLKLVAKYRFQMGQPQIEVRDRVTNGSGTPTSMQMLYHINFGEPLLGLGSTLDVTASRVVARDEEAVGSLANWSHYEGPVVGFPNRSFSLNP